MSESESGRRKLWGFGQWVPKGSSKVGQKEDELKKKNEKAIWRGEFILDKVIYRKRQVFLLYFQACL